MRPLLPTAAAALLLLPACSHWFFSGAPVADRSRPVALVETTGGVEYGAATEFGVLTLGRTAANGPCRVHYFLGPSALIESGNLEGTGSVFTRARIDLRTQHLRACDRPLEPADRLLAMWTEDGVQTQEVDVALATGPGIEGDVLADPGRDLPAGATILLDTPRGLRFCGLVAGKATVHDSTGERAYYAFAGVDRIRELLAVPQTFPTPTTVRFRPDDISVTEPRR